MEHGLLHYSPSQDPCSVSPFPPDSSRGARRPPAMKRPHLPFPEDEYRQRGLFVAYPATSRLGRWKPCTRCSDMSSHPGSGRRSRSTPRPYGNRYCGCSGRSYTPRCACISLHHRATCTHLRCIDTIRTLIRPCTGFRRADQNISCPCTSLRCIRYPRGKVAPFRE